MTGYKGHMEFTVRFLYLLSTYGMPVLCSITMLLGLIIMYRKESVTKVLGVWAIAHGLGGVLSGMYTLIKSHLSVTNGPTINVCITILQILLSIISVIALFLFAKYRYKAKGLIAVALIELLSFPLFIFISKAFLNSDHFEFETLYRLSYLFEIFKSMFTIAVFIIILIPYYKNRRRERYLPNLWKFILAYIIVSAVNNISNIILAIAGPFDLGALDLANIFMVVIAVTGMFVCPLTAVYILRKGQDLSEVPKKRR